MFTSKKLTPNRSTTDTLIGEGSVFEGRIVSAASLRLEGRVTGDIECAGDVIVGERGFATSNISAREVVLAGQVLGNIEASGKLTITATGSLQGNIRAASISIEEGGIFQGMSLMEPKASPKAAAQTASQTAAQTQGASSDPASAAASSNKDSKKEHKKERGLAALAGPTPELP